MMCMSLSTNLSPSFMALSSGLWAAPRPSAVGVRRLFDGVPENRVVPREYAAAYEPGDGLQLLERVERERRVPHDAGDALLIGVLLPVTGVAGQDNGTRLRQFDQQRLMTRRVTIRAQHGDAREQFGVAVQMTPAVTRQVEVLPVVERLEEGRRIVGIGVLVLLHDQLRLREE